MLRGDLGAGLVPAQRAGRDDEFERDLQIQHDTQGIGAMSAFATGFRSCSDRRSPMARKQPTVLLLAGVLSALAAQPAASADDRAHVVLNSSNLTLVQTINTQWTLTKTGSTDASTVTWHVEATPAPSTWGHLVYSSTSLLAAARPDRIRRGSNRFPTAPVRDARVRRPLVPFARFRLIATAGCISPPQGGRRCLFSRHSEKRPSCLRFQ